MPDEKRSGKDLEEIAAWVREQTSFRGQIGETTELQQDLSVVGDDLFDLVARFAADFDVDMSGFLWYFHTEEDLLNPGALFSKPPDRQVERIPISVGMLLEFADEGAWSVDYPAHSIQRSRIDVRITQMIALAVVLLVVLILVVKYT